MVDQTVNAQEVIAMDMITSHVQNLDTYSMGNKHVS